MAEAARDHLRPIQLPPLNFPRDGPPQKWGFEAQEGADPHCDIRPSEGGYQPPVTFENGYELRLTPECLLENDGHRPTIHRLRQSPRA